MGGAKVWLRSNRCADCEHLGGNGRNHHPLDRLFTCGRHLINMQQLPPFLFLRPDGYDVHAFRQIARFESGGFHANK